MILRNDHGDELYVLMLGIKEEIYSKISDAAKEEGKTVSDFLTNLISRGIDMVDNKERIVKNENISI